MRIVFSMILVALLCSCKRPPAISKKLDSDYGTIEYQSRQRKYYVSFPDGYDGVKQYPLVVFLHGGNGNLMSAQIFTGLNQIAKDNGFIIAYPEAFFESGPTNYVWADGRGLAPDQLGIDDVGFIDQLVTHFKSKYKIQSSKVYLSGFSNGGFLTQRIAFEKNTQFAAFGVLGATLPQSYLTSGAPIRALPMLYVFGTADPLVPYQGGLMPGASVMGVESSVQFWVNHNKCTTTLSPQQLPDKDITDQTTVTVFEYVNGNCSSKVKFYRVNGGGHTWPGVLLPNQTALGGFNLDVHAGQALWDFFKTFELCF